ncbi:MAG: MoaD/ThiS family protein [Pseudomonadota bacterium]
MPKVGIWGSLRDATDGLAEVEVDAANVRQLLDRLAEAYPGLAPQIERGVSVSIDGKIYRNAWLAQLKPDSEVFLLPRLTGG